MARSKTSSAAEEGRAHGISEPEGRASLLGSVFNVANSVVGAGMLSLPYVLRESSLLVGLAVIAVTCAVSMYSFHMLGVSCEISGRFDYRGLGDAAGGPRLALVIQVVMILYTAGACIAYAVLLGDFSTRLVDAIDLDYWTPAKLLATHGSAVTWIGLLVLTPLSCVRDLRHLQHSSTLALLCDFVTAGVILYRSFEAGPAPDVNWASPSLSVFLVSPIVAVACNTHYNAPKFYKELDGRSVSKMAKLSVWAMGIASTIYMLVSTAGYLHFGGGTKGDILNCYASNDRLAIVARFCLWLHIALTFPVIFNSTRANIHSLLNPKDAAEMSYKQAAIYAFLIVPPLTAVAANVPEVHEILAFNGALLGSPIVYTFPALIYYKLSKDGGGHLSPQQRRELRPGRSTFWATSAPLCCAAFGIVMMATGTISITLQKLGFVSISASGH